MRKILYLLFVPLLSFSQQTYIPDDNFEQALINFNIDPNPVLNDSVPTAIISTIANLAVDNMGINDLTGIEDFIYLDYLNCEGNNIEELNLTNNTFLTFLICSNNNLNELNVSNCVELSHLQCDNNNLEELNVSNNTQLIGLTCKDNDLDCVEVSDVNFILSGKSACNWEPQMDCFQKDDNAIWSLDCNYEASIQESLTTSPLLKSFNLQGKDATNTDFIFEIYENGSVKKYFYF